MHLYYICMQTKIGSSSTNRPTGHSVHSTSPATPTTVQFHWSHSTHNDMASCDGASTVNNFCSPVSSSANSLDNAFTWISRTIFVLHRISFHVAGTKGIALLFGSILFRCVLWGFSYMIFVWYHFYCCSLLYVFFMYKIYFWWNSCSKINSTDTIWCCMSFW